MNEKGYFIDGLQHVIILCLTDDPFDPPGHGRHGGGEVFVFDLGRHLVRHGNRVTYVTRKNAEEKPLYQKLGSLCSIHRVPVGPSNDMNIYEGDMLLTDLVVAVESVFNELNEPIDVVHSHYWLSGEVARRIRAKIPFRFVHSILSLGRLKNKLQEQSQKSDNFRDICEVQTFNESDFLISVCPTEIDDLKSLYPEVRTDHLCLIPYGADPEVFFPRPETLSDYFARKNQRIQNEF